MVSFRIGDKDYKGEITLETLNTQNYFDIGASKNMGWRSKKVSTADDGRIALEPHSINVVYIKIK